VKPAPFTYHAPASAEEALALLAEHGDDAKVLAGGQSLLPLLNFRLARPGHLIDINRLPGLDAVERTPTGWRIPALVRQRTAERSAELAAAAPLLTDALRQVAHPQIRNRGTVCGSLAHADSAAELPSVMVALDAQMTIATASGPRQVSADEFFQFHLTTAVEPEELLLAVEFGDPGPGTYTAFEEFAPRRGDFCLGGGHRGLRRRRRGDAVPDRGRGGRPQAAAADVGRGTRPRHHSRRADVRGRPGGRRAPGEPGGRRPRQCRVPAQAHRRPAAPRARQGTGEEGRRRWNLKL
jgi:carbon-monoxide dehydrogenase medium subunit